MLILAVLLTAGSATGNYLAADREAVAGVARELVCYCGTCSNQSVQDCTCGTASAARQEIGRRLDDGETPASILEFYRQRYGEQILIVPGKTGFNLVAWITPFLVLLFGATGLLWALLRLTRSASGRPAPVPSPPHGQITDKKTMKKLERELRELED